MKLCPECENKNHLSSLDMTPELLEEMALNQQLTEDTVSPDVYKKRLETCKTCSKLIGEMTCSECGCFVQLRANRKSAFCINGRW
ncbi:MAG: DUF6171 family protein [Spirochaetales bacterium]|nr:DUF6171 family protein [Spirochaetales bacterium]